jgi:hypothetical protein
MDDHILLDTLDAIEIAELLEFMLERVTATNNDAPDQPFPDCCSYGIVDLRADVERLTNRLLTRPFTHRNSP